MARIRRILHATDFSKASARALNEAIKLAKQNRAEILIVHIIEPTPYVAGDELDLGFVDVARSAVVSRRNCAAPGRDALLARGKCRSVCAPDRSRAMPSRTCCRRPMPG